MGYTSNGLAGSNTVSIVGVFVAVEGVKLTSLFPSQSVTEVCGGTVLLYHGFSISVNTVGNKISHTRRCG